MIFVFFYDLFISIFEIIVKVFLENYEFFLKYITLVSD